jgi:hypothetical protein
MTTTDTTTPDLAWLDKAEAVYAAEEATHSAESAEWAADLAKDVNERLAELGITPVTPASVTGDNVVPALLVPANSEGMLYGVHATFDEEDGLVLLVSDHRLEGGFEGLRRTYSDFNSVRSVVNARRGSPVNEPAPKPRPSLDAQVIVDALDRLTNAVESVARNVSRP